MTFSGRRAVRSTHRGGFICRLKLSSHLIDTARDYSAERTAPDELRRCPYRAMPAIASRAERSLGKGAIATQQADMVDAQRYGVCFRWCRYLRLRNIDGRFGIDRYRNLNCGLRFSWKACLPRGNPLSPCRGGGFAIRLIASICRRFVGILQHLRECILAALTASGAFARKWCGRCPLCVSIARVCRAPRDTTRRSARLTRNRFRMPVYIRSVPMTADQRTRGS